MPIHPHLLSECSESIARGGPCLGCGAEWYVCPGCHEHTGDEDHLDHSPDCPYIAAQVSEGVIPS